MNVSLHVYETGAWLFTWRYGGALFLTSLEGDICNDWYQWNLTMEGS